MGAYSDRVLADGASYYWRLGETVGTTAVDAKGAANGTISGGVTLNQPGALSDGNTAMTFNGTTGKVATAAPVSIVPPFSVEGWIRLTAPAGPQAWASSRFPNATQDTFTFAVDGAGLAFFLCFVTYANALAPNQSLVSAAGPANNDGQWHHMVWTYSAGTVLNAYRDGVLVPMPALNRALIGTTLAVFETAFSNALGSFFNGSLDEVAIYPRALTATEIAAHYTLARQSVSWPGVPWWVQIQGDDALDNFNVWEPITPSNTVDLPRGVSGGLWVGSGGDVAAVMQNNVMPVVFAAVPTGAWLPIAAKRINATGTTATGLVALYET